MKLITCEFNMDSGCVELHFDDGTELDIDCSVVESEYAQLVLSKDLNRYLNASKFDHGIDN